MMILLALLLMSVSIFLVDRKESRHHCRHFSQRRELEAEVADTPEKLLFGLAFRETLPPHGGMLYIFERKVRPSRDDQRISVSDRYYVGG